MDIFYRFFFLKNKSFILTLVYNAIIMPIILYITSFLFTHC